jgi:Inner membrane component of T3SS, cytoplasmic domain
MALLVRIYFNAVFGALGGLLGWMLFGVFGDPNSPADSPTPQLLLGGALIGGIIGFFVVSVEAIRDRSLVRFCRLASYGVILGAVGGALGMVIGDWVNFALVSKLGAGRAGGAGVLHLLGAMFARGLGWMFLGIAVGLSEGIAARSLGKLSYGTLGGAIGGFVGGCLFGLVYLKTLDKGIADRLTTSLWGAFGLVILGACIGSLSALVQAMFQPASLRVVRGWQEGREYALLKPANLLGRDEHADIALFRDMNVEKKHAIIERNENRYVLVNQHSPPEQTRVNEEPVASRRPLNDGDRIQLGNIILRFQMRAATERSKKRSAVSSQLSVVSGR